MSKRKLDKANDCDEDDSKVTYQFVGNTGPSSSVSNCGVKCEPGTSEDQDSKKFKIDEPKIGQVDPEMLGRIKKEEEEVVFVSKLNKKGERNGDGMEGGPVNIEECAREENEGPNEDDDRDIEEGEVCVRRKPKKKPSSDGGVKEVPPMKQVVNNVQNSVQRSPNGTEEMNKNSNEEEEELSGSLEEGELAPERVFHVLDEVDGTDNDDDSEEEQDFSSESEISENEIENMLEENLQKSRQKKDDQADDGSPRYKERKLVTLEELKHNHFDLLPEGWIQITHKSGMPVYLHKASRVCTFASRPYYLGQGSARKHAVPLSAIPCLQYKRALEEEVKAKEQQVPQDGTNPHLHLRTPKIETAEENKITQSLGPFAVRQYCKSLFRFKTEQKLHFVSWADRRKYSKARKSDKQNQRPTFPDGTKLIKFPIQNPDDGPNAKPKTEWIMNPNGKSYICILHEYVQHALKKQPTYEFESLKNPATPYSATVIISGMRYGSGTGTSKKQAKLAAAKASLEILIPEMREKICSDNQDKKSGVVKGTEDDDDRLSIFDEIKVEDPRVAEFCAKATEPSPYSILLQCLQRNFGLKEMPIDYKINPLHKQANEFIMTVGKHTSRVVCKNKKDGKQRASQGILQALHPHITSWGSLLRLYGNKSMRNVKEKKQEEQEITMLQSKASLNSPNYAILSKLKEEMLKLRDEQNKRTPIGIFIPPSDVALPSPNTDLNKIDL